MSTVAETLIIATRTLASHSDSPRLDAELLLGKVLGVGRTQLIVSATLSLAEDALRRYRHLIDQRLKGAPIAYLTGTREFWSMNLKITPAVLVPRPETETLVELALALVGPDQPRSILDLGTGSGAIALAIARERPRARITGVDISATALSVARENSRALDLLRITWRRGSWFAAVPRERFDIVIANPPYIADGDPALRALAAEPALALTSGPTGLEALTAIIEDAAPHLEPGGTLLLEHGSGQARAVARLLERHGFSGVCSHHDHSGNPRVTQGTVHSQPGNSHDPI
ncbi:MAG: peptide chain release factor N(5)-glutamine methyltransferase [Steroidobacteraceae bacterium]